MTDQQKRKIQFALLVSALVLAMIAVFNPTDLIRGLTCAVLALSALVNSRLHWGWRFGSVVLASAGIIYLAIW